FLRGLGSKLIMGKNTNVSLIVFVFIVLLSWHIPLSAQQKKVSGLIQNTKGLPFEGATITSSGGGQDVISHTNGRFAIEVVVGDTLSVSSLGYLTQKIVVDDRSEYVIELVEENEMLEEIVVVGYGTVRKR